MKGNIQAGKLWFALVFGWTEKKMYEILSKMKEPDKYDYSKLTDEELRTAIDILAKADKRTDNSINIVFKPV